jgi:hypothetical protein
VLVAVLMGLDGEPAAVAAVATFFVVSGVRLTMPIQARATSFWPAASLFAAVAALAIGAIFRLAVPAEVRSAVTALLCAALVVAAAAVIRRRPLSRARTIVVGPADLVSGLTSTWATRGARDVDVVGICTWAEDERPAAMVDAIVRSVPDAVRRSHCSRILIVGHGALDDPMSRHLVWSLQRTGVECVVLTDVADFVEYLSPRRLGGHIAMTFTPPKDRVIEYAVKTLNERILAVGILVAAVLPLLVLAANRWMHGQHAFGREDCAGRDGVPFGRYVLLDAEGKVRRRGALAGVPQLLNVVAGDMALVGPAPVASEVAAGYAPWLWQRLAVRPGVTGPAQVNGVVDAQSDEAVNYDLGYVNSWNLALDLRVLRSAGLAAFATPKTPTIPV